MLKHAIQAAENVHSRPNVIKYLHYSFGERNKPQPKY